MTRGWPAVRGRGLEPRWLLTASTSNGVRTASPKESAGPERQGTPGSVHERRIPVTRDRNSGEGNDSPEAITDVVAVRLAEAGRTWEAERDRRSLRRALLDLLQGLDE